MTAIGAVVFDLDGTLVDSRLDIARAVSATLRAHGRQELELERVLGFVGDGSPRLIARVFGLPPSSPELAPYLQSFLDFYRDHPTDETTLMPGVTRALDELGPLPLGVCTNKPRPITELVLENLGLARRFAAVVAGGDTPHPKPHPAPLLRVAAELGVEPSSLVVVGDGPQDVECGHAVGARTVGLEGGFLPLERLLAARPDALLDSLAELPALIRSWNSARAAPA
jgi:phosphoglycolate phosphatase